MSRRFTDALAILLALAVAFCSVAATKPSSKKKRSGSKKPATEEASPDKPKSSPSPSPKAKPTPKPTPTPSPDWKVVKVGLRDYLTLDNVAKFYGLPTGVAPAGRRLRLSNEKGEIEVLLDSREMLINGVRNWLCFPIVAGADGQFLVSRVDLAKTIEPQLRPQMIGNLGKLETVVLDPGHGAWDKGATSPYGTEKDFALDVARQLKPMLEAKGLKVIMTRDKDVFVPLEVRARIANATANSIFVSIHFNATDMNPAATGFEIYSLTPRGAPSTQDDALALHFLNMQAGSPVDAPSLALSMSVYHSVLGQIAEFDRGIKRARFAVLRLTRIPAILVEGGFMTERAEARLIANPAWRGKLAEAISVGIQNYKGLVDKRQRPMLFVDYRDKFGPGISAKDLTQAPASALGKGSMLRASIQPVPLATATPASAASPTPAEPGAPEQAAPVPPPIATDAPPRDDAAAAAAAQNTVPVNPQQADAPENSPPPASGSPSPTPAQVVEP